MASTYLALLFLWRSVSTGTGFQAEFLRPSSFWSEKTPAAMGPEWRGSAAAFVGEPVVKELKELARMHAVNRQLVIVVASDDWEEMLMNWVVRAHQVHVKNYIIFATSADLAARLGRLGAPVLKLTVSGDRAAGAAEAGDAWNSDLWMKRWVLVADLLKDGFDVLHADSDAIMVNSPRGLFGRHDADIIVSRGMPKENWLLCMGFVYMRSTPSVLEFMPRFLSRVSQIGDDQRAFNQVLSNQLEVQWSEDPFDPRTVSREVLGTVHKPSMLVAVLPNHVARRLNCAPRRMTGNEIVAHCRRVEGMELTQNTGATGKAESLETVGLWSLRRDWRGVDQRVGNWDSYIENIAKLSIGSDGLRLAGQSPSKHARRAKRARRGPRALPWRGVR